MGILPGPGAVPIHEYLTLLKIQHHRHCSKFFIGLHQMQTADLQISTPFPIIVMVTNVHFIKSAVSKYHTLVFLMKIFGVLR